MLTTSELLFAQVAKLQSVEVGGEHAHRVIANPHGVAASPEEQPLELTVTEQSLSAEVPGGKNQQAVKSCVLVVVFLDLSDHSSSNMSLSQQTF